MHFRLFGNDIFIGRKGTLSLNEGLKKLFSQIDGATSDYSVTKSNAYQAHVWIYACINAIARRAARATLKFYKVRDNSIVEKDVRINTLFGTDGGITPYQRIEGTCIYKLMRGNAYWLKDSSPGFLTRLVLLDSDCISPDIQNGFLIGWKYASAGARFNWTPDEIVHFKFFSPGNSPLGLSPIDPVYQTLRQDASARQYDKSLLDNGTALGAILEFEGEVGPEARTRMREDFESKHQGAKKAGKLGIIEGGGKYKELKLTPQEMSYIESRKMNREEICATYDVPPAMVGIFEYANYANSEAQIKMFWHGRIIPELKYIEDKINSEIMMPWFPEYYAKFDIDDIPELQTAMAQKITWAKELWTMGFTADEINDKLDLGFKSAEWRKHWWVGLGQVPAEQQMEPPEPVPSQLQPGQPADPVVPPEEDDTLEGKIRKVVTAAERIGKMSDAEVEQERKIWKRWSESIREIEKGYQKKLHRFFFEMRNAVLEKFSKSVKAVTSKEIINEGDAKDGVEKLSRPFFEQAVLIGGKTMLSDMGLEDIAFTLQNHGALRILAARTTRIRNIIDTVSNNLDEILGNAVREGKSREEIAQLIKTDFGQTLARCRTIAQTEIVGASNAGRFEAMREGGAEQKKWINSYDENVRDSHQYGAGGVEQDPIPAGQAFSNGLMYPGDLDGAPEDTINCRCSVRAVRE